MKREGKSGEGEAEKEENLGEKLRRGALLVGKRGGPSTPVHSWRLWAPLPPSTLAAHDTIINNKDYFPFSHSLPSPSARKLAAALWEFQHYFPLSKMHRGVSNGGGGGADSRLRRHPHHHYKLSKDKGLDLSHFLADNSPSSPEQPGSASSLRRHVAASLMQHHRLIERNNHALQPVSPASYGSSMEVAHYNPAVTPTSSLDFKGRIGGSNYNLKTSTELLKVLNRIWSLEEQHASNISMIKALKMELDQSRLKIKELLRDRQAGRHEMDDLMKQMAEDKLVRKSKEQERIHAAVQSVRDELEDERKLRKRSESLHRKLARDFSEVKSSLSNALKELESERKSRILLEDLCDEFAGGIKDYEQEVHALKQKSDKDWAGGADRDRLILHISESWLDERMQMQLEEAQCGFAGKNSMVDKLSLEIETFLQTKRMDNSKNTDNQLLRDRHNLTHSGSWFFLPLGTRIYNKLVDFIKGQYRERGYQEVVSPNMYNMQLWETSGHAANYKENMFLIEIEKQEFGLKPMNCPGHCLMFQHRVRSYRELPLRLADFGVLHRNEASGALTGLTRVRRFQQDDAHIFCRESQIKDEVRGVLQFIKYVYGIFGFTFDLKLSTRPEKYLRDLATWEKAETALGEALDEFGKPWQKNEGDGAFYGPKIDISISDALNRKFQCATLQLDFQLPARFELYYSAEDEAKRETPVMIHRAILGSVERMFAILLEHYKGKWPFWLSPRQAIVCPVSEKSQPYALKVREAQLAQYNYILVVGEEEANTGQVSVRVRDKADHSVMSIENLLKHFVEEVAAFH